MMFSHLGNIENIHNCLEKKIKTKTLIPIYVYINIYDVKNVNIFI
jgi:hypothetical protein